MNSFTKAKQIALFIGDLMVFYLSLFITLVIRYGELPSAELWSKHLNPFTGVFLVWLITFYIADLYNIRSLKNSFEFNKKWAIALLINGLLAMAVFYFLPSNIQFTPKTNLLLMIIILGIIGFSWRRFYNTLLHRGEPESKILLIDQSRTAKEIIDHIQGNPQLGYELKYWLKSGFEDQEFQNLAQIILKEEINLIVVPAHIKKNSVAAKKIYQNLVLGIEVMDLATLYSLIFQKVPLMELEEVWFLENITKKHKIYESIKYPLEILLGSAMSLLLILPSLLIALLIKLTSRGPVLIRQRRIGQNEQEFTLYKFRSMRADAEKFGPQWSGPNDLRLTWLGRFLRFTHLDEVPQLINIIRGDLSFVGPRPERPEFVQQLKKDVPYYDLRHLVRPGLTGWAQINYRYGSSTEDAYQKLQYDIYYLKNYSFWLDLSILIKTIRLFFTNLH